MWRKIQNYFIRCLNLIKKKEQCKDKITANLHWIYSRLTKIEDMSEKYSFCVSQPDCTNLTYDKSNLDNYRKTKHHIQIKYSIRYKREVYSKWFHKFKFYFIKLNSSTSFTSTENKLHNVPVYIKYFEKVLVWRSVL